MIPISTITIGGSSVSTIQFTGIPQNYTDLKLVFSARTTSGSGLAYSTLTINGAQSTAVTFRNIVTEGSATVSTYTQAAYGTGGEVTSGGTPGTSPIFNSSELYFYNYSGNTAKAYSIDMMMGHLLWAWVSANALSLTAPITSMSFYNVNNFAQYTTATLYGIRKY
ncbi:hypothetical protein UFOVP696_16 [uncultured Caudovirales phage]|uniref:Uncharacterized protein n=1 Tax=uncultured Caudovirales phage TaxID=2100421 RepID=A0A6J5NLY1_9CAUD|nr:hypothetical protein UFOVP429_151 [uncultured Caudovirales phage]CAB4158125.1 hypothetical protein UFOVP696_16 [uncultured Caudovirales phage]